MNAEELVVGETYWCLTMDCPVIVTNNTPDSLLGLISVTFHPSTGRVPERGCSPQAFPKNLRLLTPLEKELL